VCKDIKPFRAKQSKILLWLTFMDELCLIGFRNYIMKRLNIYNGLIITLAVVLPIAWVCRRPVTLPDVSGENMFSVRSFSVDEGMAEIRHHTTINGAGQLLGSGMDKIDIFESDEYVLGNRRQGAFSSSPTRLATSRSRKMNKNYSEDSGLLGSDSMNSFATPEAGNSSWGWLADDIKSSERSKLNRDERRFDSQKEPRRLFDDRDKAFGTGLGSDHNSGDDSFFHRQSQSW